MKNPSSSSTCDFIAAKWEHDLGRGKFDHLSRSAGHRHDSAVLVSYIVGQVRTEWRLDGELLVGTHAERLVGTHAERLVGTHAELLVGIHAERLVGTHAERLVGTHAELLVGTHEMKLNSFGQLLEEAPHMQPSVMETPSLRYQAMVPPALHLSCRPRRPNISQQLRPGQAQQQR